MLDAVRSLLDSIRGASEVRNLREGVGAIEERARYELGMIKENEIFVQVVELDDKASVAVSVSTSTYAASAH